MTYPVLAAALLGAVAVVVAFSAIVPGLRTRLRASALTALVLCALTALFDNAMIAADLFSYPAAHLSGLRIGLAPLEDFSYPIAAAFLLPAVAALLRVDSERSPDERS